MLLLYIEKYSKTVGSVLVEFITPLLLLLTIARFIFSYNIIV